MSALSGLTTLLVRLALQEPNAGLERARINELTNRLGLRVEKATGAVARLQYVERQYGTETADLVRKFYKDGGALNYLRTTEPSPRDAAIPWMGRLAKERLHRLTPRRLAIRGPAQVDGPGPREWLGLWSPSLRSILDWLAGGEAHVDFGVLTYEAAVEYSKAWHETLKVADSGRYVPVGTVLHTWDDGWTLQKITDPDTSHLEGESMGNCLAGGHYDGDLFGPGAYAQLFSIRQPSQGMRSIPPPLKKGGWQATGQVGMRDAEVSRPVVTMLMLRASNVGEIELGVGNALYADDIESLHLVFLATLPLARQKEIFQTTVSQAKEIGIWREAMSLGEDHFTEFVKRNRGRWRKQTGDLLEEILYQMMKEEAPSFSDNASRREPENDSEPVFDSDFVKKIVNHLDNNRGSKPVKDWLIAADLSPFPEMLEIKGRNNEPPHPKYRQRVRDSMPVLASLDGNVSTALLISSSMDEYLPMMRPGDVGFYEVLDAMSPWEILNKAPGVRQEGWILHFIEQQRAYPDVERLMGMMRELSSIRSTWSDDPPQPTPSRSGAHAREPVLQDRRESANRKRQRIAQHEAVIDLFILAVGLDASGAAMFRQGITKAINAERSSRGYTGALDDVMAQLHDRHVP